MTNQAPPRTDVASLTYGDRSVDLPLVHGHRGRSRRRHLEAAGRHRPDHARRRLRQHRRDAVGHHLPRRRAGNPALSRLPHRELAESSTFLEVAYLLIHGELPTRAELDTSWPRSRVTPSSTRRCGTSSTASRTTRTRWRCSPPARRDEHLLPGQPRDRRSRRGRAHHAAADRQAAHHRGLVASRRRSASPTSTRATTWATRRTCCT